MVDVITAYMCLIFMLSHLAVIYIVIYTIGMYVGIIGTIGTYGGSLYTMLVTIGLCMFMLCSHTFIYIYTYYLVKFDDMYSR